MKRLNHEWRTSVWSLSLVCIAVLCLCLLALRPSGGASHQDSHRREDLHGVLWRHRLTPPLRAGRATLQYSADGQFLMMQTESAIYVLSKNPMRLLLLITADRTYPARFSADSRRVIAVSHGYTVEQWSTADGKPVAAQNLHVSGVCLSAELSRDGKRFACLDDQLKVTAFDLSTGQPIYSGQIGPAPTSPLVLISLDSGTAFSSPFGLAFANTLGALANRGGIPMPLAFSPDGNVLVVGNPRFSARIDLTAHHQTSLHGSIQKRLRQVAFFESDDSLFLLAGERSNEPAILSLKTGDVLSTLSFVAEYASAATNPRYVLFADWDDSGWRLFDLEHNSPVSVPANVAVDVFQNELALFNDYGDLFLYDIGEVLPKRSLSLPLDSLPVLRSAAVTPELDKLAFSTGGQGGVFQTSTGAPIFFAKQFSAANFLETSVDLLSPRHRDTPAEVSRWTLRTGQSQKAWSGQNDIVRSGGAALLEYSPERNGPYMSIPLSPRGNPMLLQSGVSFRLRALDPDTGRELWKRSFSESAPIPFADPQGDGLILGWGAKSQGARSAAKRVPGLWESFRRAKLADEDTLFEALNVRTGEPIGSALVQAGSGPASYQEAFAVGHVLVLLKDGVRVSLYSLVNGAQIARLVGGIPSGNERSNLLALEERAGLLGVHDLNSGDKLDELRFADPIAYMHFSDDGKRLLVFTDHQEVFVVDVSQARAAPTPASP